MRRCKTVTENYLSFVYSQSVDEELNNQTASIPLDSSELSDVENLSHQHNSFGNGGLV